MSAEGGAFNRGQMDQLMDLAEVGVGHLVKEQAKALT
jgi:ribonuclease PH